jgi:hypothetical protein
MSKRNYKKEIKKELSKEIGDVGWQAGKMLLSA